jgi:hypothetical protein
MKISLFKFQLNQIFLSPSVKTTFYDKRLHVTNVFHKTIASFLFMLISQHNDRLRCEPLLISHFNHKPFPIMCPYYSFFACNEKYKTIIVFFVHHIMETPKNKDAR